MLLVTSVKLNLKLNKFFTNRTNRSNRSLSTTTTQTKTQTNMKQTTMCPTSYFGCNVFDQRAMADTLPPTIVQNYQRSVKDMTPIDLPTAEAIAKGLLQWASTKNVTHYTHWFQPLGRSVAEKHDTFLSLDNKWKPVSRFTAKELLLGEPDGSSFPNGGMRSTHAARGYTTWDVSSHPFVLSHGNGAILYIPACFVSWKNNQALDHKTILLRSEAAVRREGLKLFNLLGSLPSCRTPLSNSTNPYRDGTIDSFHVESGIEQEFFIVDRDYWQKREDLQFTGRSLMGLPSLKGQTSEDQYFAEQSRRVLQMLEEVQQECWKVGILVTTRHREVAPGQYEIAPRFTSSTLAIDQNLILMRLLKDVSREHNLSILFHPKPFPTLNGSGKHLNFSFGTNRVASLLEEPTKQCEPHRRLEFMFFLGAMLRAVHTHAPLFRWSVSGADNDHRLGANEAPPPIMSAHLGEELSNQIESFLSSTTNKNENENKNKNSTLHTGIPTTPLIIKSPTDRNRTSPFAFTGNKFEFRAVGSAQNPAMPNTILNLTLADSFRYLYREITTMIKDSVGRGEHFGEDSDIYEHISLSNVMTTLSKRMLNQHKSVIFNGNGYSEAWVTEAKRRGLPIIKNTPEALEVLTSKSSEELFQAFNILEGDELKARQTVGRLEYCHTILLEAKTMILMVRTLVIPTVENDQKNTQKTAKLQQLNRETSRLDRMIKKMTHQQNECPYFCCNKILPLMTPIRTTVSDLQKITSAKLWPLPTESEMLFSQD
jgi:glutamine synthetase